MNIRPSTVADSASVTGLLKSIEGVWQAEWRDDCVDLAIAASDGLAFVAVEQEREQIVGFICGHDLGFRAYLSEFAVAESHQRAGIGTALLRAFESALAGRGCQLVVADVYPPAEPFYRANGWGAPSSVLLSHRFTSWAVWRQDDSGSKFLIEPNLSESQAKAMVADFEAKGHKQTYWCSNEEIGGPNTAT